MIEVNPENTICKVYEHPFGERIKLLLRLEIIFSQALSHQAVRDQYETQLCLDALFALLNLTNRYELRAELLKELERIKTILLQFKAAEGVSDERVSAMLDELKSCVAILHGLDSKHIDRIRNIEFLNKVKLRNIHDTGSYLFELPELQYWLLQTPEQRTKQIQVWLNDFLPFKTSIDFILRLIRESAFPEAKIAEGGVYIRTSDSQVIAPQLLRIEVDKKHNVYPSVSGNEYRFVVRFMEQKQPDERPSQAKKDIGFCLLTCGI